MQKCAAEMLTLVCSGNMLAWLGLAWLGLAWLGLAWLAHSFFITDIPRTIYFFSCKEQTFVVRAAGFFSAE